MSTSPTPELNAYAPPQADTTVAPVLPSLAGETVPTNVKVAGWLMIANGALLLITKFVAPIGAGPVGIVPAIIDFLIGSSLARGNGRFRIWAIIRLCLGAVLYTALLLPRGNYIEVGIAYAAIASLLGLLFGRAGVARIAICCSVYGLYLLLSLVGIVALASGSSLLR
jgi:hypothetical protein